jgi:lysophospholipase L1-like esterase
MVLALTCFSSPAFAVDRVVLVGDSTVATYSSGSKKGWGYALPRYFQSSKVRIINEAKGGRSSETYRREGLWEDALRRKPKYVLIQFGHNDSHKDDPRYTNPNKDFKENLRDYVDESRKHRAIPILVTPPVRLLWNGNRINHRLSEYVRAMKQVASEMKVPLLDLDKRSGAYYEDIGKSAAAKLFVSGDRTHTNAEGANALARLLVAEIRAKVPGLTKSLK